MKKIAFLLLACLLLSFTLVSCGGKEEKPSATQEIEDNEYEVHYFKVEY